MNWRESLPARVAIATSGLLTLVLVVVIGAAYVITALTLRQGLDRALLAALPEQATSLSGILTEAHEFEEDDDDHDRRVQVLDVAGSVLYGPAGLPVDNGAVREALEEGEAFVSLTLHGRQLQARGGPDWWQALTPGDHEVRVAYVRRGERHEPVLLQVAAPTDEIAQVLGALLRGLLLVSLLGALLCGLIAWRMAARTYLPLDAVVATAADISTSTPALRIPDIWHDRTLRRLIGVLNSMIGRLQGAYETQGRFAAAAAHELRGPLGAMRAELEVALRRDRTPAEYRSALEGALEETTRLSSLSEHLLLLARLERGAALTMERDLSLQLLATRAAAEVSRTLGRTIEVDVPDTLRLQGDPVTLERMLNNLMRNAVEAGATQVHVQAEPTSGFVVIRVIDNGPGIEAAERTRIFEPFYRADPARRRDGGAGLGLAIVKAVVAAHGGRVAVQSPPGGGTTFMLWLPISQDPPV